MMRWMRIGLAAVLMLAPFTASAEDETPVVTHHSIAIGGRKLAYTAEAGHIPIRDVATGQALGHMFYVAYRVAPKSGEHRPLTFLWNGGPGLPAASVQFEGFGPRRLEKGVLVDNADTALTDSDLVFVDPIGTGFSRAVDLKAQEAFTSIVGDIAANTEFVRAFVLRHGDEDTPLIVSGQSYGAGRAGSVGYALLKRKIKLRGIVLVSNSQGLPHYTDQTRIAAGIHVADYAVAALYYRKLPPDLGVTPDAVRAEAESWARSTYLPALARNAQLTALERDAIVAGLARRTGLDPADIDRKTLIVGQGFFLGHLVAGQLPYYSDYRIIEPHRSPSLEPAVRSIRHDLGYRSDLIYAGIEPVENGFAPDGVYPKSINQIWLHSNVYGATRADVDAAQAEYEKGDMIGMGHFGPDLPGAAEAIALEPKLHIMVMHGAYDPLGGCSIDAEHARHLTDRDGNAIRFHCYLAGHAIYRDAPARAAYASDLRALARTVAGESE